jgi:predicted transcriptional regulator
MACISPDGTINPSARKVLEYLREPADIEKIMRNLNLPMFRIRVSIRELKEIGYLTEVDENYQITQAGIDMLTE